MDDSLRQDDEDPHIAAMAAILREAGATHSDYTIEDFPRLARLMKAKVFIDCRNVYKPWRVQEHGFVYESFGRGSVTN